MPVAPYPLASSPLSPPGLIIEQVRKPRKPEKKHRPATVEPHRGFEGKAKNIAHPRPNANSFRGNEPGVSPFNHLSPTFRSPPSSSPSFSSQSQENKREKWGNCLALPTITLESNNKFKARIFCLDSGSQIIKHGSFEIHEQRGRRKRGGRRMRKIGTSSSWRRTESKQRGEEGGRTI